MGQEQNATKKGVLKTRGTPFYSLYGVLSL